VWNLAASTFSGGNLFSDDQDELDLMGAEYGQEEALVA
jgi:hypothetical protein